MSDASGIWVVTEQRQDELTEISAELLSLGNRIAKRVNQELCAVVGTEASPKIIDALGTEGVDKIYVIESSQPLAQPTDYYAEALCQLITQYKPEILLCGSTILGRDLAPRLAARLNTCMVSNCTSIDIGEDGSLLMTKPLYEGKASATFSCSSPSRPCIITVMPGSATKARPLSQVKTGTIVCKAKPEIEHIRMRVIDFIKSEMKTLAIEEADIVVSAGRGVAKAENIGLLERLAEALGGTIAGSRMAMDAGWITRDRLVGNTGKIIRPKLYVACGISGASQHVMGMHDSDFVVAINKDTDAPIMKLADVAVVGDLLEIIPAILSRLERRPGAGQIAHGTTPHAADEHAKQKIDTSPAINGLNIAVCVKQVFDSYSQIGYDFRQRCLRTGGVPYVTNPYDEFALEYALQLKDRYGGRVTAVSSGSTTKRKCLEDCVAAGSDQAVSVCDTTFAKTDAFATARALAKAIELLKPDVILCGLRATDDNAGMTGALVAESLHLPLVTGVVNVLGLTDGKEPRLLVYRNAGKGDREVVEVPLPALVTVEIGPQLRYPSTRSRLAAKKAKMEEYDLLALGLSGDSMIKESKTSLIRISPPKPNTRGLLAAESSLPALDRLRYLVSGGISERGGKRIEGAPEEVASKLVQMLEQGKFIPRS